MAISQRPIGMKRVVLVLPSTRLLAETAGPLLDELTRLRHSTLVLAPDWTEPAKTFVTTAGAAWGTFPMKGDTPRWFADRSSARALSQCLQAFPPHAVAGFGAKAAMLAAQAARDTNASRVVSIMPSTDALAAGIDRRDDAGWRRLALKGFTASSVVIAGSETVRRQIAVLGLAPSVPVLTLPPAGIDVQAVPQVPLPGLDQGLVFLMIPALSDPQSGLAFRTAATQLAARAPGCRFRLACPEPASKANATATATDGPVSYLGVVDHLAPAIAAAHVVVVQAIGDALPPGALDALARGRPLIIEGTSLGRELVDDRVNGCLAAGSSADDLVTAMDVLVRRPDLIPAMARAARLKAERRFDRRIIVATLLDAMGVNQAAA